MEIALFWLPRRPDRRVASEPSRLTATSALAEGEAWPNSLMAMPGRVHRRALFAEFQVRPGNFMTLLCLQFPYTDYQEKPNENRYFHARRAAASPSSFCALWFAATSQSPCPN